MSKTNSVVQSNANQPNGYAGLDANGNMRSPFNIASGMFTFNGETYANLLGTSELGDPWTPPQMMRFGGLGFGQPIASSIIGEPDGANDSGAVLYVGNTDQSYGAVRPGLGPDALSNGVSAIASYGNIDGATFVNQTDNPVPVVRAGADIEDWEGNTHAVTFGCDSMNNRICFSPALPSEWIIRLHKGENIMTNVIGPHPVDTTATNAIDPPPVLASTITAVDPNGNYVDTVGWAVSGSGISNGFIPMVSSYAATGSNPAVTAGTLDTKWSSYSHAAVFFGAFNNAFSNYEFCRFNHTGNHGNNTSAADSMMHSCTAMQYDVFDNDPNYTNFFGGMGIAWQGPGLPTSDSQMVWLSGGVPTYNRYRYVTPGTRLFDTTAGFNLDYPEALPTDGTINWQSQRFMQGNEVSINGVALKLQSWGQVDSALPSSPTESQTVATSSIHLGLNYGSGPNTDTVDSNNLGQIVFNYSCDGRTGSVALGAGGTGPSSPNIGACVDSNGYFHALNGIQSDTDISITGGHGILLKPSTTNAGWAYIFGESATEIDIANSAGSPVTLNLNSGSLKSNTVTVSGTTNDGTSTLDNLPTANLSDGAHMWCTDCKVNSVTGVEAYYHSSNSKWLDSQNNALSN